MKILFFYESLALGGQQTYSYNLVKCLDSRDHELHYVYLYGDAMKDKIGAYATLANIPVVLSSKDYLFKPWRLVNIFFQLRAYFNREVIDVVISQSGISSLLCGLAARSLRIKHYRWVGCSLVDVEKTLYKYYNWIQLDRLIDGYFSWPAVFRELSDKGVSMDKCHEMAHRAVNTEEFYPFSEEKKRVMRLNHLIREDELVIGWVGRICSSMEVGNTVELGKYLFDRGFTTFKLLLVGGGPWVEGLKKVVADYGLQDHVIITGWVPMDEVNSHINCMDIVPLLSKDPHGGSIVREAIAAGIVTISVDGPGKTQGRFMLPDFSYLVEPDHFIAQAADVVLDLAADKQKRLSMGKKAREYAEQHMSFETEVDGLLRVIS